MSGVKSNQPLPPSSVIKVVSSECLKAGEVQYSVPREKKVSTVVKL